MLLPSQTVDLMSPTPYTDATKVSIQVPSYLHFFVGIKRRSLRMQSQGPWKKIILIVFNTVYHFHSIICPISLAHFIQTHYTKMVTINDDKVHLYNRLILKNLFPRMNATLLKKCNGYQILDPSLTLPTCIIYIIHLFTKRRIYTYSLKHAYHLERS